MSESHITSVEDDEGGTDVTVEQLGVPDPPPTSWRYLILCKPP